MLFVLGEIDLRERLSFGVDVEAELLAAVGEEEIRHLKDKVVAAGLVDDLLVDCDLLLFAFHNHPRMHVLVVDHYVAASRQAVERYRCLHLHQFQGVSTLLMKK